MDPITKRELLQAYKDLRRARRLVADPKVWIQGSWGESEGLRYSGDESLEKATRVCSLGAIAKVQRQIGRRAKKSQAGSFLECAMGRDVIEFNDCEPHQRIITKWDEAIKIARGAAAAAVRGPDDDSPKA